MKLEIVFITSERSATSTPETVFSSSAAARSPPREQCWLTVLHVGPAWPAFVGFSSRSTEILTVDARRVRQWIESVNATRKGQLGLENTADAPSRVSPPASPSDCSDGRRDLTQLDHREPRQTIPDRLRSLTRTKESTI